MRIWGFGDLAVQKVSGFCPADSWCHVWINRWSLWVWHGSCQS